MAMKFNADEVFEMAERVETNGAEFYTRAADLHAKQADVKFLRQMAKMEYDHRDTFAALRKRLPAEARALPDDYPYLKATLFLTRTADILGGEGTLSQADPLSPSDSLAAILRKAILLEQQAIAFYVGLQALVPDNRGRKQVDKILAEEQAHVVILARELRKRSRT
jgi:rubrerythrin